MRMEPALHCVAALHSPSTGIIDSHALMLAYLRDAERKGALLALKCPVTRGEVRTDGFELHVTGAEPIVAAQVVNSAGLRAPSVARRIDGYPIELAPPELYAKGNYYTLATRSPFSRLVYPVPEPGGLGVHVTLDLGGQARFGPDVQWVDRVDYAVDPRRAERFYGAIRRYWPGLPDGALEPGYAGVRPKISGRDKPAADFVVQGPHEHGVRGLVNLFGIESPGLTASLPLADAVLEQLQ
jgi:L-2-hydroxyglutarate oxidase LhgO